MKYFKIYKPYGYLSQFTKEVPTHNTLADLEGLPADVYPVGRLDKDSEGLLLLTNDSSVNYRLLHPKHGHRRIYWVQVEGEPSQEQLKQLSEGVAIRIQKKPYRCKPLLVSVLHPPAWLPNRVPPIRVRKTVPDTWLQLEMYEGKNRQVRRMCAQVGLPVLRLVRYAIEFLTIQDLSVGEIRSIPQADFCRQLNW